MTTEKHNIVFVAKSFVAGGVAGMTSKTTVAPLDRIKILLQAHNSHYKHYGVVSGLKRIIENENVSGLYRGNGAQMVRIFPYAAVQFLSFEVYKKFTTKSFGSNSSANHGLKFLSGSMAGVTAAVTTYPLDLVRARLAFRVSIPTTDSAAVVGQQRSRIVSTIVNVIRNEGGISALYKGLTPTVLGMIPYSGFSFYCFERLKYMLLQYCPTTCGNKHKDKIALNVPSKLMCGGVAGMRFTFSTTLKRNNLGAIAQTFSYPLDVARRRMQLSMLTPETQKYSKGLFATLTLTYREHGIVRGLYRGMTVNYIRAIPMVAVSFSTYELMKQFMGLDTGIDT
ncbi:solute carrier protein-like protein [Leptotrombidium deliense]|uniref:Solute carrier protein-like protein n=1 Tax=Leptotrombidium deliense TaxID=299467 RepID=A0A443SPT2_9ACAR|nr:solute carrier protein-like protein [Leptotrombidium deliense]